MHINYSCFSLAAYSGQALHRHRKDVISVSTGGPIVDDEFSSTVPDLNFRMCMTSTRMDYSPIRQSFEFGKSISTTGKSILNFIELSSLVAKYRKM